jgi:sarcosine oxidase subunit alpha
MNSSLRRVGGGLVDPSRPIAFRFDGRDYAGLAGDTLASALLANGVRLAGRSFKYHRPRGLVAAGVEEPNILVRLGAGARADVNLRATEVELHDGLVASPVNCWPSPGFDLGGVNRLIARFIPAGFYYKTFMWPSWHLFEGAIRRAAGLGRAPDLPDPDDYESRYAHCDLLIVGGGPAGLAAARAAAGSGARILLVEQDVRLGGRLIWDAAEIDGLDGLAWAGRVESALRARPDTRILTRTSAIGYFDDNLLALVERMPPGASGPRERLWQVRAKQVVLATGAIERPLVFAGNDRPGVMLASAVRHYLNRYAVLPGRRAVVFANNDDAYKAAFDLVAAGAEVPALVDTRESPPAPLADRLSALGVELVAGGAVTATTGAGSLRAVQVVDAAGRRRRILADLLAVSGGFNPTVQLFCQSGGRLDFDAASGAFRPGRSVQAERSAGAAAGIFGLGAALAEAQRAGCSAAGLDPNGPAAPAAAGQAPAIQPCWRVFGKAKAAFVDFQNDVTAADIALAARENYRSVEHLKRYTTLGMAPDQGKLSNVNGLAIMAGLTGRTIEETGTTRYRFPFTPVSFGALSGRARGPLLKPIRLLRCHDWHAANGAAFEEMGGWQRPLAYPAAGEDLHAAEQREALATRSAAGLFDASPLGKIEVKGPDAATFLDRVYANRMSTLKPGRIRYGLMLNELGVIIDDGVVTRLADQHFLLSTGSGVAGRIAEWLEEWLACEWPELRVLIAPQTTGWGVATIAGPLARDVIAAAGTDIALASDDFPHMRFRTGLVAGIPARVSRVSFTGELSYEIAVPASSSLRLWERLVEAGGPLGLAAIGLNACLLLRLEKGYIQVGADTDGTTAPADIGWTDLLERTGDFIGRRSLSRPANLRPDRHQLVGLMARDGRVLPAGAHLRAGRGGSGSEGFVTSTGTSPILGRGVALGMVRGGRARMGEVMRVVTPADLGEVEITGICAYDPAGERLRG